MNVLLVDDQKAIVEFRYASGPRKSFILWNVFFLLPMQILNMRKKQSK